MIHYVGLCRPCREIIRSFYLIIWSSRGVGIKVLDSKLNACAYKPDSGHGVVLKVQQFRLPLCPYFLEGTPTKPCYFIYYYCVYTRGRKIYPRRG